MKSSAYDKIFFEYLRFHDERRHWVALPLETLLREKLYMSIHRTLGPPTFGRLNTTLRKEWE